MTDAPPTARRWVLLAGAAALVAALIITSVVISQKRDSAAPSSHPVAPPSASTPAAPTAYVPTPIPEHPLLRYLPALANAPGWLEVNYWAPHGDDEYARSRRARCGFAPEPGDPNRPMLIGAYYKGANRSGPSLRVQLWSAWPDRDVVGDMVAWGDHCARYVDEFHNTHIIRMIRNSPVMPSDAIQFEHRNITPPIVPDPNYADPNNRAVVIARNGMVLRAETFPTRENSGEGDLAQMVRAFVAQAAEKPNTVISTSSIAQWPPARIATPAMAQPAVESDVRIRPPDFPPPTVTPDTQSCENDPLASRGSTSEDAWRTSPPGGDLRVVANGTKVLRERPGVDGLALLDRWVQQCRERLDTPEVCVGTGWSPSLTALPPIRLHDELVTGYERVALTLGHAKGGNAICEVTGTVAQTARVRGVVLYAGTPYVSVSGVNKAWPEAEQALREQRDQLAYVIDRIHHA